MIEPKKVKIDQEDVVFSSDSNINVQKNQEIQKRIKPIQTIERNSSHFVTVKYWFL